MSQLRPHTAKQINTFFLNQDLNKKEKEKYSVGTVHTKPQSKKEATTTPTP